jgi:hypothetical protein
MDDQISDERRREAYRNAASNLLSFCYEAHRVQSPTSGAWHPCQCSRGEDHVGAMAPADPLSAGLAILAARGYEATDPVILTMPRELADMVDWASDPSVVRLPLDPADQSER